MKFKTSLLIIAFLMSFSVNAQIDRSKMPKQGPTPTINLGKPYSFQLKNGLTVLVVEDHKLPRVSISVSVDNPPHAEGDKTGVSSLVSSMLGKGTSNMSKDAFNEEVDFMGASIFFGSSSANGSSLSKYTPRIVELMADGLFNPLLIQEELDIEKTKLIENAKSGEKSAAQVASRVRNALVYGKEHAYGEYLTEETINNVTLGDIKQYFATYFTPSNAYMVISGDIKPKDAKKLIKKKFSKWSGNAAEKVVQPDFKHSKQLQIDFVDMDNAVQSELAIMSGVQLRTNHPDHHAALLMNYILGNGASGYLNMNLREKHGYTYGAGSSIGRSDKLPTSTFRATTKVRNAVTDSAVVQMILEIDRIKDTFVTDKDLATAKAKYLGNFIMSSENPNTKAGYTLNIKTKNLPEDFYETFIAKIDAVTKEDIKRVANKYLDLNNSRVIVVGKGKDVLEGLENIKYKGNKVPVKYYDKFAEMVPRPEYKVEIPDGVTAQSVLQKYIDAIGGIDKLNSVKSVHIMAEGEMQGMTLNLEMKRTSNNEFAQQVSVAGNVMQKQVFDGEKGYNSMQGNITDIKPEEVGEMKITSMPFPELFFITDKNVTIEGIEKVEGKNAYKVKLTDKMSGFYDMETGIKVKQTIDANAIELVNYKTVEGIKFPFTYLQAAGPAKLEFNVIEIILNKGVTKEDFK